MHSMYSGYMEKAIKYSEKALVQVDRLNGKFQYREQEQVLTNSYFGFCLLWAVHRAVTKISSCEVFAVSRWETEQSGSSFDLIFLLFPTKIARGHAHSNQVKSLPLPPPPPAHSDSPVLCRYKIIYYETCKWYFKLTYYVQDHWTVSCANFVFACLFFLCESYLIKFRSLINVQACASGTCDHL